MRKLALFGFLACSFAVSAHAAVVVQNTATAAGYFGGYYVGQSFTTPAGFSSNELSFNFYDGADASNNPTTPGAFGTAYLLTQEYTGTPADLGPMTPGVLAVSTGSSGGAYTFAPTVTLAAGTTYYLYQNGTTFSQAYASDTNPYSGGQAYVATSVGTYSRFSAFDFDFTLSGTLIVPEPSTWAMLGLGAVGAGGVALRRQRRVA